MPPLPGERVVGRQVPGGWALEDEAQAEATLIAAAYHVCRWLMPITTWEPGIHRYAVCLPTGMPAVLDVGVMLEIGRSEVSMRVPISGEDAGRELVERIREQALTMVPGGAESVRAPEPADDLPF